MEASIQESGKRPSLETLRVVVDFIGAGEPFKDDDASRNETAGQLKASVLKEFGLQEGQTSDGNTTTFWLYHEKTKIENLSQTLGEIAGDKKHLHLKLTKQVFQG